MGTPPSEGEPAGGRRSRRDLTWAAATVVLVTIGVLASVIGAGAVADQDEQ
jgi:hypothetical protein